MRKIIALALILVMCLSLIASAANTYTYTLDFKEVKGTTVYLKKGQRVTVTVKQTKPMYQYLESNLLNTVAFPYEKKNVKTEVKTKLYYSINDNNNKNIKGGSWSGLKNGKKKSFDKKITCDGYYTIAISNQTTEKSKYEYTLPTYQMSISIK